MSSERSWSFKEQIVHQKDLPDWEPKRTMNQNIKKTQAYHSKIFILIHFIFTIVLLDSKR